MGHCTITVHLIGPHHNSKHNTHDANRMAERFVDELKTAGHKVEHASITYGARDDLLGRHGRGGGSRDGFHNPELPEGAQ